MIVNQRNLFHLRSPFVSATEVSTVTRMDAISSFGSEDILSSIYIGQGLTQSDYELDKDNDSTIVTLQTDSGAITRIPIRYIDTGLSTADFVDYVHTAIVINLGTMPKDLSFTGLKTDVEEAARNHLGIDVPSEVVELSPLTTVSGETHAELSIARTGSVQETFATLLRRKTIKIEELEYKVSELERCLIANCFNITISPEEFIAENEQLNDYALRFMGKKDCMHSDIKLSSAARLFYSQR